MILVFPVMVYSNAGKDFSEYAYYKIGVLLKVNGVTFKEVDQADQGLHMHGRIPSKYNIVDIDKAKYIKQYDLWFLKLTGFLEVSQAEIP